MRTLDALPAMALAVGGIVMITWLSLAPRSLVGPVGAVLPPWADAHTAFRAAADAGVPLIDVSRNGWVAVFDLTGNAAAAASLRGSGLLLIEPRFAGTCATWAPLSPDRTPTSQTIELLQPTAA